MSENKKSIIEFNNVTKTYSKASKPALREFNLKVYGGDKIGLIGANGSGKTTLLRLLMNFIKPDSGTINILSEKNLESALKYVGFVSENQEGLENFTPHELLVLGSRMFGVNSGDIKKRVKELLKFSGLENEGGHLLEGFSKGMSQRTFISLAILNNPKILILDEPMSGLDSDGQKEVKEMLFKLPDTTMIYASHNLDEIENFASSVIILHDGKLIKKLDLDEIHEEIYTVEIDSSIKAHKNFFEEIKPEIISENEKTIHLQFLCEAGTIQNLISKWNTRGIQIHRLRSRSILEDYYTRYVKS